MLHIIRSLSSSSSSPSDRNLPDNNVLHNDDVTWQEESDEENQHLNVHGDLSGGEVSWHTRRMPQQTRGGPLSGEEDRRPYIISSGDENTTPREAHHHHHHHQLQHNDTHEEHAVVIVNAEDQYDDAFALQPEDFPEMQPFIGLNPVEENDLIIRHQIGVTIVIVSVVFNLCNPLLFIAGGTMPVFSYMNSDGTRSMVYLVGESVGEAGVFSGQLQQVDHCLNRSFDSAALGIIIAAILLIIAIFTACCAFRWTTGLLRFVRPFLFSGASLGGAIASFFVVRGYSAACNGAFRWYHAEPGLYYIVFGTAITVIHTLVLYAQVSRYPIRKLTLFNNNNGDDAAALPEEHNENRALMVIGEGNGHNEERNYDVVYPHNDNVNNDLEEELLPIHRLHDEGDRNDDELFPHTPVNFNEVDYGDIRLDRGSEAPTPHIC